MPTCQSALMFLPRYPYGHHGSSFYYCIICVAMSPIEVILTVFYISEGNRAFSLMSSNMAVGLRRLTWISRAVKRAMHAIIMRLNHELRSSRRNHYAQ